MELSAVKPGIFFVHPSGFRGRVENTDSPTHVTVTWEHKPQPDHWEYVNWDYFKICKIDPVPRCKGFPPKSQLLVNAQLDMNRAVWMSNLDYPNLLYIEKCVESAIETLEEYRKTYKLF